MKKAFRSPREKFLGLSLESSRKSYYPQLQELYKEAEEKQQRLQLLIDNLPARISFVNSDRQFILVNQEYEKLFKMNKEEMVGRHVRDVLGEDNYSTVAPFITEALQGKQVHFEAPFHVPETGDIWYDVNYVPVFDASGKVDGFYVLGRDLTQRKLAEEEKSKLESQLFDAQKFKAIGTLAGGIAHDFNNLLMGIQGRSSLMRFTLDPSHPLMEHIEAIDQYISNASDLTRQLLGLARGGKYEVTPVDLNNLVRENANMFGRTRKEISIHLNTSNDFIVVEVDKKQIEQVLLNLFVNAWQAMPDGGDLYISTKIVTLREIDCRAYEIPTGKFARISVTDTGTGMTEEIKKSVFDPFFTTREKQRGTGLGLASAYGIIKNHGGIIKVYSEVGQGTTFDIYLPLSDAPPLHEEKIEQEVQKGHGTVLLVDDEKMVLDVGKSMLEALGYDVITAQNGQMAVEVVSNPETEIRLIILDMIMPNMDGGKTFDKIREIRPEITVILSSGYSLNGQAETILKRGCNGFIQKPFNLSELSVALKNILDDN